METVKVDVQKLQLLNDRIAQTIEALNQLRMSMHGIQHSQVSPFGGYPYGAYPTPSFGYGNPLVSGGWPVAPQNPYAQFGGGIQHTAFSPFATPFATPFTTPFTAAATGIPTQPTLPFVGNGISHTAWDPTWATRAAQTWSLMQPMQVPVTGA